LPPDHLRNYWLAEPHHQFFTARIEDKLFALRGRCTGRGVAANHIRRHTSKSARVPRVVIVNCDRHRRYRLHRFDCFQQDTQQIGLLQGRTGTTGLNSSVAYA
jgi:hypothetical protein